jgi:hypothetical protein
MKEHAVVIAGGGPTGLVSWRWQASGALLIRPDG